MKHLLSLTIVFLSCFCYGQKRTLDSFIAIAKENSTILKGIQSQIQLNRLDSQLLRLTSRTQLNFIGNEMYAPVVNGWGYDEVITNIAQISGMVQASKTFLSKGNMTALYNSISLQNQSLRDSLLLSARDLAKTITEQYIATYADQLTMNYTKELYDLLRKEADILKRLAQSNVIRQVEFLAFDVTVQQQELTYLQSRIKYSVDFLTLNYLAGIEDTAISQIEEPNLSDSIYQDYYTSVFYQRFVTDSIRIKNERSLLKYGYRPAVNAFTDAGYNSSLQNSPYKNVGFSFGLNIKIPLYYSNQKNLKIQKLDVEEKTRLSNKAFYLKQYSQQLAQLKIQLKGIEQVSQKIKVQLEYSKTLILAYEKLFEKGDVKITDFVTALTNYLNVQGTYRENVIDRLRVLNQINYWYH